MSSVAFLYRSSKCIKIVGGWGFAPDLTGGTYSAPPDPWLSLGSLLLRPLLLSGREGMEGEERAGERRGARQNDLCPLR